MNNWIITVSFIAFVLNLPFGYLRTFTKKFSIIWFICIHAPIPIVAVFRIMLGIEWIYIPMFLVFAVIGQVIGARIRYFFQPE